MTADELERLVERHERWAVVEEDGDQLSLTGVGWARWISAAVCWPAPSSSTSTWKARSWSARISTARS